MLPEKFLERMKSILSKEYPDFEASLGKKNVRGIRINTTKIHVEDFVGITKLDLSPIPYAEDGFIPSDSEKIGATPEHHSGMFYVQDPGAMATVKAVKIEKGWKVLDACSAPGGKASQMASAIGDEGFLLANEYVPKRAKIIVSNFERLGIKNAIVTSLDTKELSDMFQGYFDLVLCDAPCSGEGMFRKYEDAVSEWSEENVIACAKRQTYILDNLAGCVKAGGYLLYSTCTYSAEENEENVLSFLETHPEFSLEAPDEKILPFTENGLFGLNDTRRFYPHKAPGEGQFIALMRKSENVDILPTILYKELVKSPTKDEMRIVEKFISDNLSCKPKGRFIKLSDQIALVSHDTPIPPKSVFMSGVLLGEIKKNFLLPHHQFFSAYGRLFKLKVNLKSGDKRVSDYLYGEEIETELTQSGYCAVMYENVALGGGKISQRRVKNHYPKGLRNSR